MKTTIILILFMFSFNCLMAVPVQIKGKVQEKGTGNPIEFADEERRSRSRFIYPY